MVFFDDNPSERELIKLLLPEVETPDFPHHPYLLNSFIKEITEKFFRIYRLTSEDKAKTRQYQENAAREEFQRGFNDFTDYLASLEIKLKLVPPTDFIMTRLAQLTQKTNQFNLTTKRYSESDLYALLEKNYMIMSISVSDRFGDSGITGLIIISKDYKQKTADIDTFLMSCRILGKGIEEAFLLAVMQMIKDQGINKLFGHYVPTVKNEQVKEFYDRMGFTIIKDNTVPEDSKYYCIDLTEKDFKVKSYYTIINE